MARSLNRAQLIGNLTKDPELRYTPNGAAVCSFGLATNRNWTTDTGEKKEEAEFHRIVAWNKLAELCSQFLTKGRKVYVEGRLSTRSWTAQDGTQRNATEIVIDDMILLDSRRTSEEAGTRSETVSSPAQAQAATQRTAKKTQTKDEKPSKAVQPEEKASSDSENQEVAPDDIPF